MTWFWYLLLGIIYVAILYALVKPGSPAAAGVTSVANALSTLVTTAVGGNSPSSTPQGGTLA